MQFIFGAGEFYGVPQTDATGASIANATPIRLGIMQEMSLEFSTDVKELYGQYQFAVDVARGKGKVSGKIKSAQISGQAVNSLFFGQTQTGGTMQAVNSDTTGTAIPATPYQITVTPPNSGTYLEDLGVVDANGLPLTKVASSPAVGQYSNVAGVYTFAAADTGNLVFINYRYSFTSVSAKKISVTNQIMGAAPLVTARMQTTYRGKRCLVNLYSTMFTKLALLGTKIDDYSVPELDLSAFANGAGQIADIFVSE